MIAVIPLNDSNTIIWDFMSKLDLKSEYLLSALEQLTFQEKNNFSDNVISALREKKDTNLPTKFPLWEDGITLQQAMLMTGKDCSLIFWDPATFEKKSEHLLFPFVMPLFNTSGENNKPQLALIQSCENKKFKGIVVETGEALSLTNIDVQYQAYDHFVYSYAIESIKKSISPSHFEELSIQEIKPERIIALFFTATENSQNQAELQSLLQLIFNGSTTIDLWESHQFVSEWRSRYQKGIPILQCLEHQTQIEEVDIHKEYQYKSPVERALEYVKFERSDIIIITLYGLLIGIISLVTPLTINALVTTISAGVFTMPLIVLSSIIFVGILIAGGIGVAQLYVVEVLQQRIFVNTAFEIAHKFPQANQKIFQGSFAPELLNRFFDVITLQKGIRKLLIDGLSALIIGVAGLFLLAFISPTLLALGVLFVFLALFMVYLLGRNGLKTSIKESKKKYDVAAFLEDIARCVGSFKLIGSQQYISKRVDELAYSYVKYRKDHFKILLRQFLGFTFIRAAVNTGVLAIGGYLVFERQITLGQLVATEIVIVTLITSLEKLTNQIEIVYDTLTAFDKVGNITDIPLERRGGEILLNTQKGIAVQCEHIAYAYDAVPLLKDISFTIESGKRVALVGKSGEGKSTLSQLFLGVLEPSMGSVLLDDVDVRRLNLESIRKHIGLVLPHDEIFDGTIWDNITLGREWVSGRDVMDAIRITQLDDAFLKLPTGLSTKIISHGKNLSTGQIRRLMIARAIVHKPRLLILDEAFTGIEEKMKLEIINELYAHDKSWTIISITHDPEALVSSDIVYVLSAGRIEEIGSPKELAENTHSHFRTIFPDLSFVLNSDILSSIKKGNA